MNRASETCGIRLNITSMSWESHLDRVERDRKIIQKTKIPKLHKFYFLKALIYTSKKFKETKV